MLVLPGRFELLSDDWIAAAHEFLRTRTGAPAAPLTVSGRLTDAPPHLKLPRDAGEWTLRLGERAGVERGFDAAADVVIEGDYQAALTAAQFVGVLTDGGLEHLQRELAVMHGLDAVRVRGAVADPGAAELLALLHDHLARRTVENPDLAHRARRLGLHGRIREMEEQGYTVVENAISPEFADAVRRATLRAMISQSHAFSLNWMLYHGRELELLAQNPLLMTLIDASLGRGAVIASYSAVRKGPGPGAIPLHTDYAHVPEPYPDFAMTGVGVWALEDWTVDSGPTWIIPGSHRMRRAPRPGEGHNGGVPIEMPKGSVVFFTQGVWHWQGDRREPGERITLHAHFNRGILRSLEPKRVDVQMLHRNPPRLAEMLGEDDWFDKISAAGRDYGRLAYMNALHAFTESRKRDLLGVREPELQA